MARQRRGGGGFRGPELRGTLGTLLRTTLQQAGSLRDVLERGAREGRSRLDDLRSNRRRTDALAELGEVVLDLIRRGEIDLGELPEARELVRYLDELDDEHDRGGHRHHDHDDHDHDHPHPHDEGHGHDGRYHDPDDDRRVRATSYERPRRDRPRDDDELAAAIRPATRQRFDDHDRGSRDDGTVSAKRWSPPSRRTPSDTRVWRPPADAAPPPATDDDRSAAPARPAVLPNPHRKGGISFDADDSDDDLERYMHPDDVPPKRTDGES